ncbi:hypothetical protein EVAR_81372_1 [Eumeta japonica]|uniref:Uncharacterized protein n=1 Tax=Eumeta variegata TaxID=151549 RepID=A0A4C1WF92_EUMVA|nr:hypothetical protein EVAR_81372_1 [Eumeta japonica]
MCACRIGCPCPCSRSSDLYPQCLFWIFFFLFFNSSHPRFNCVRGCFVIWLAAHEADRRPSDVNGPPTIGQGSTHRRPVPRRSNRARRRPLIRLSVHPTAAVKATRVSEPLPPPLASSRCPSCCSVFTYMTGESGFLGFYALVRVVSPVGEEYPEASVRNLEISFPRRPGRRLAVRSVVSTQRRPHSASIERRGWPRCRVACILTIKDAATSALVQCKSENLKN